MSKNFSSKSFIIVSGMAFAFLVASPTFASTIGSQKQGMKMGNKLPGIQKPMPGVVGTVSSVGGSTIIVNGKNGIVYSVDATNAEIMKDKNIANLSTILVGDIIMVKGKITGTTVVATVIQDGFSTKGKRQGKFPGVEGTVTAINDSSITVSSEDGNVYTIDASNARVTIGSTHKKPAAVTLSNVQSGDMVMVIGPVNGTNITASQIFDGKFKVKALKKA